MAWVKMKDGLGNVLTVPEQTYNDIYRHNDAYSVVAEQPIEESKKGVPFVQKTKKIEVKNNGSIQEDRKPERDS